MFLVDALIVSHFPHSPTVFFTLHSVTLRHDLPSTNTSTVSEQYPHLIFESFESKLGAHYYYYFLLMLIGYKIGHRIRDALKYLFPVPKEDATRVMSFVNDDDYLSFRYAIQYPHFLCPLVPTPAYLVTTSS
jgi:U3 small nucleolar ribonucleoprotein protein IMP4